MREQEKLATCRYRIEIAEGVPQLCRRVLNFDLSDEDRSDT
jgi:hypothetical protein